jgi:SAM-dependent methyltransferase
MNRLRTSEPEIAPVVWHDLECGAYRADLALWRELAERAAEPGRPCRVLDLGCGTGRVALFLASQGHRVTGLDLDRILAAELNRRAVEQNVPAGAVTGDVRDFALGRHFDVVLAPMQMLQLLANRYERIRALTRVRAHLRPGGLFGAALLDLWGEATDDEYMPPLPDMREAEGWVWSSQAVGIQVLDAGLAITLDRHRRAVSPRGEVAESDSSVRLELMAPVELEDELVEAHLEPVEQRVIPATEDHVGSVAVIAERRE